MGKTHLTFLSLALFVTGSIVWAKAKSYNDILTKGFVAIKVVSANDFAQAKITEKVARGKVDSICKALTKIYKRYKWPENACGDLRWQADFVTQNGNPLLYIEFGQGSQVTLVLGGVHPDEITPTPLAFRFARYLAEHPEEYLAKDNKIIIAPLVNPDGFLSSSPVRTNANGVDLNRNFFTKDWYALAKEKWLQSPVKNQARIFPGHFPNSEWETLFQIDLIERFSPNKIISIHAPLHFLDYDGPGDQKHVLNEAEKKAKQLVHEISEKAENYRVVDYTFYPGSLGNYAGNERLIPTITLELSTTEPNKLDQHWRHFLPGLLQSINYKLKRSSDVPFANSVFYSVYKSHSETLSQ